MVFFRKIKYTKLFRHSEDVPGVRDDEFSPEKDRLCVDGVANLENDDEFRTRSAIERKSNSWLRKTIHYIHLTLTLALIATLIAFYQRPGPNNPIFPQMTYCSPAQDALRYEPRVFTSGLDYGRTKYQGPPTPERNEAWEYLFLHGLTRISASEAAPMPNKTLPIPDEPDHYMTSLAVFHQLHCLNSIRLALWNSTTDKPSDTKMRHLDHCVDMLRQAVMCGADISPFIWARDPRDGRAKGISTVVHTCRDFEAIRQWGAEHPMLTGWSATKVVKDDPLGWADHHLIIDFGEITDWEKQEPEFEKWKGERIERQKEMDNEFSKLPG